MIGQIFQRARRATKPAPRASVAIALFVVGCGLSGCADMSDDLTLAFADPAKYDLYNCKQLEPERQRLTARSAELQGLMAKADTGVAGPVVAELAYRNDYVAVRGQSKLAEEAWRRNKCQESAPVAGAATPAAVTSPAPPENPNNRRSRSGSAIY